MLPFRRKHRAGDSEEKSTSPETAGSSGGLLERLRAGLRRTGSGLGQLFLGRKQIDEDLLDELETLLLMADVGVDATRSIIDDLTARLKRNELADTEALRLALREDMLRILEPVARPLELPEQSSPAVVLTVGVNGAGKTTTGARRSSRTRTCMPLSRVYSRTPGTDSEAMAGTAMRAGTSAKIAERVVMSAESPERR